MNYQTGRARILNMDRNSNAQSHMQLCQDQRVLSLSMAADILSRANRLSSSDDTCNNTQQGHQTQDLASVRAHHVNIHLI
jgi:hypothetical protein